MFLDVEVDANSVAWAVSRLREDAAFQFITDVDSYVADRDFTRRLYEYARGILVAGGGDV